MGDKCRKDFLAGGKAKTLFLAFPFIWMKDLDDTVCRKEDDFLYEDTGATGPVV